MSPIKDIIPPEFRCPLSLDIMIDPVILSDGHSYERKYITQWIQQNPVSPITKQPISEQEIKPNVDLKQKIQNWKSINRH